jgi:hypothetical protein
MFLESYSCVLYQNDVEETQNHLFLNCPFAIACWGLLSVDFTPPRSFLDMVQTVKDQIHTAFFMMAIFTMCWTIWGARNDLIFKGTQSSLMDCKRAFAKELALVSLRIKSSL